MKAWNRTALWGHRVMCHTLEVPFRVDPEEHNEFKPIRQEV